MNKRGQESGLVKKTKLFQADITRGFVEDLLPVIQNLTALGYSEVDIGSIIGFAGQLTKKWLKQLKQDRQDVAEAVKTGRQLAKAALIAKLVQASLGYDYYEEDQYWVAGERSANGQIRWRLERKTTHRRHQPANMSAMLSLADKLMPDVFESVKKESTSFTEDQIRKLSGALLEITGERGKVLATDTSENNREPGISNTITQFVRPGQPNTTVNETVVVGKATNSV